MALQMACVAARAHTGLPMQFSHRVAGSFEEPRIWVLVLFSNFQVCLFAVWESIRFLWGVFPVPQIQQRRDAPDLYSGGKFPDDSELLLNQGAGDRKFKSCF